MKKILWVSRYEMTKGQVDRTCTKILDKYF